MVQHYRHLSCTFAPDRNRFLLCIMSSDMETMDFFWDILLSSRNSCQYHNLDVKWSCSKKKDFPNVQNFDLNSIEGVI